MFDIERGRSGYTEHLPVAAFLLFRGNRRLDGETKVVGFLNTQPGADPPEPGQGVTTFGDAVAVHRHGLFMFFFLPSVTGPTYSCAALAAQEPQADPLEMS